MMVFTHLLVGLVIGVAGSALLPVSTDAALLAGVVGGGLPDVDIFLDHRRTLHYPVVYSVLAALAVVGVVVTGAPLLALLAIGLLGASAHSVMDVLGGGKEMRPWNRTDDRAVYDHVNGRWVRARRYVHDGSLGDLLLAGVLAGFAYVVSHGTARAVVVVLLALAAAYTAFRRRITEWISDEHDTFSAYVKHVLRLK